MIDFDHWLKRQGEQPEKEQRRFLVEDFDPGEPVTFSFVGEFQSRPGDIERYVTDIQRDSLKRIEGIIESGIISKKQAKEQEQRRFPRHTDDESCEPQVDRCFVAAKDILKWVSRYKDACLNQSPLENGPHKDCYVTGFERSIEYLGGYITFRFDLAKGKDRTVLYIHPQ